MSTTTKLGEEFLRVPKLDVSGSNWVIYKDRFHWAIDARGILDHIDGTGAEPVDPISEEDRKKGALSAEQKALETEWKKNLKEWKQNEAIAKQQIATSIPDSLFMKIRAKGTAQEIWNDLENHFQKRSRMVSVDLRRRLQDQRCPEKGDMLGHFATLRTMREELASMGQPLSENDFYAIILGSLPSSYDPYISAVNATSSVLGKTLSADDLMLTITEEYERRNLKNKNGKKDENVALYSNDSGKDQKGGSSSKKKNPNVECFNCKKKGHYKSDCWAEGGGKEGQGPRQKGKGKQKAEDKKKETGASSAAKEKEKEKPEEAWLAFFNDDSDSSDEASIYSDFDEVEEVSNNLHVSDFVEHTNETTAEPPISPDFQFHLVDLISAPFPQNAAYTTYHSDVLAGSAKTREAEVDLYDSGATRHMSGFRHRFINYTETEPVPVLAADKRTFNANGKGDMYIYLPNGDQEPSRILLTNVLFAPSMGITLVSISRIAAAGSTVVFTGNICKIYNKERIVVGVIKVKGGLYRVYTSSSEAGAHVVSTKEALSIDELHRYLGHVSHERARLLVKKGLVEGVELRAETEATICESCEWAKGMRKAITKVREEERSAAVGEEIHSDLWGPAPVETIARKKYYVSFTDDYSRYTTIYFLQTKDETFSSYQLYEAWLLTQHHTRIKCLRSDRGGEYLSEEFSNHLKKQGTIRKLTVHDTPEHNGVAERLNRTILEKVRAMFHDSGLPKFLWAEATAHAVYLKNRTWTRTLGNATPYELLNGQKPNLSGLHPWGCKVRVHDTTGSKLDGRSKLGRWVGFDPDTRDGHRIYWPEKRSVSVERSVKFNFDDDEVVIGVLPLEGEVVNGEQNTVKPQSNTPVIEKDKAPDIENVTEPTEGRGKRIRKETEYIRLLREGAGVTGENSKGILPRGMQSGSLSKALETALSAVGGVCEVDYAMATVIEGAEGLTPSYEEARRRPDWPKWEKAVQKELENLTESGTWEICERPPNTNVVDCRWVLRIKKNFAGEIEKYRARLVAKGYTQIYGIDYYETYAPVARLASLRLLLAIAARNGWPVDTFDFDSAYLNAPLGEGEVIYMEQPMGHETRDRKRWVWKLKKALYGLKQGAKSWYDTLYRALSELGFTRAEADHGVFFKDMGSHIVVLGVHVDDCMVTGSSTTLVSKFKVDMDKKYKLTDLGPANWLLGIKISRDLANKTISLSQRTYIESIITRFNFDDLKPSSMPIDPAVPLLKSQSPSKLEDIAKMRNIPFREAVGALMYAAMGTRPDIAFATSTVAQFAENPGWSHWEAVKRIFRYLLGTKDLELVYGGEERGLTGYVDADGASQEHRRAISGYVFMVDGGAVSWSSKKQELVTLSTTEAEYVAATHAAKEAIWLRRLISEVFKSVETPTTLFCDSKSAIALAHDGHYHARTKHIDIRYHFIRYIIEAGTIKLVYCPTNDMTADVLTKALPSVKAKHFASALGLCTV